MFKRINFTEKESNETTDAIEVKYESIFTLENGEIKMNDKKIYENEDLAIRLAIELEDLKKTVEQMNEKRGGIFLDWMKIQNNYLQWEESFDPSYLRAYKRAEIVLAHFGFNVGAEYGGMHYAVVVKDSSKKNPNLNVVPLSSMDDDEAVEDLHRDRVFLDVIKELNDKRSVAIPDQIRPISKLRVYKPRKTKDGVFKLNDIQMDLIDDKIRRLYTKK